MSVNIPFINEFSQLPEACFSRVLPTPVSQPTLVAFNHLLADSLGISSEHDAGLAAVFSGNQVPANADPLAMAYSGHQFGHLNPQLGDGRAILLGDVRDNRNQLRDIQLKGSGRTPYSRNGDGRSPLGPAMREYLLCEAMHALGVPTTRALALVTTGDTVYRERREPGAVFTRVAASHIRVGTFQYFALRRDEKSLRALADHTLARHFPDISPESESRYLELFTEIVRQQAELIARWMLLGFIHGVMNTDNMTVSGETIDYGPCAFMDNFSRSKVFSSIDQQGRYAYQNQPAIGQWNLARLAEALLGLFPGDEDDAVAAATQVLNDYSQWHQQAWESGMSEKLGLGTTAEQDRQLAEDLLTLLEQGRIDYSHFFHALAQCTEKDADRTPLFLLIDPAIPGDATRQQLEEWLNRWQDEVSNRTSPETAAQKMRSVNPAVIPRNHRIAEAINAGEQGDFSVFYALADALRSPYQEHPEFSKGPRSGEEVLRTFCGT